MTQRTAHMDLDWHEGMNGLPSADLPDIPGFPCPHGRHWQVNFDNVSTIGTYEFLGYGFYISLRGAHHEATLEEYDFGFSPAATVEEAKQQVESLSPEEIADAAVAAGVEPVDDATASRHATASRKADKRTAHMDLDWEFNANMLLYEAVLPAIPDYPGVDSVDVWKDDEESDDRWCFALCQNGYPLSIRTNEEFGIPSTDTADEMMGIVDELDPEWIADKLAELGYAPDDED